MKPEQVDLKSVDDVDELVNRVLRTRLREARSLAMGLRSRDKQDLHDFRIACKRLRYAAERFKSLEPSLERIAESLTLLQDALGDAHDRDVLLSILPAAMAATERRLCNERERRVDRAVELWNTIEQLMQALDSHRI